MDDFRCEIIPTCAGCEIGERPNKCPKEIDELHNRSMILDNENKRYQSNLLTLQCIAQYGVETPEDAVEYWIESYAGVEVLNRLLRDMWLIVCSYIIPSVPIPTFERHFVSSWYGSDAEILSSNKIKNKKTLNATMHSCNRALQLDPEDFWCFNLRSSLHLEMGRPIEALLDAHDSLKIKANYRWAVLNQAKALEQLGQYHEAIEKYRKALEIAKFHSQRQECEDNITRLEQITYRKRKNQIIKRFRSRSKSPIPSHPQSHSTRKSRSRSRSRSRSPSRSVQFHTTQN